MDNSNELFVDSPERIKELRELIQKKKFLRSFYENAYAYFKKQSEQRGPGPKTYIELGAGPSFLKEYIPSVQYSDLIPYEGLDLNLNALEMPFQENSVDGFFMLNVTHHIPDGARLFEEISRTLKPGGFLSLVDQNVNFFSRFIFKYLHNEAFDDQAGWQFESQGPLSSANGALAWILFRRDREKFVQKFSRLKIVHEETVMPLQYWCSGGLRFPQLLPEASLTFVQAIDRSLLKINPNAGSFLRLTLRKEG